MNIKSSQILVEEAKKNIENLNSDEVKKLAEKKRNHSYRHKGYKRTLERRNNKRFKTYP